MAVASQLICQNGRAAAKTAKMADVANLMPNHMPLWQQQISCQIKIFFFLFLFFDNADI